MKELLWYLNRIKKVTFPEYLYRIGFALKKYLDKYIAFDCKEQECCLDSIHSLSTTDLENAFPEFNKQLINKVEKYLDHSFVIFGINIKHGKKINWHLDPKTGKEWPLKYWGDINYRDGKTIGGIKLAWELNRLHHFPQLAIAEAITKKSVYKNELFSQLKSWQEFNPYPKGINWISGIESGIRLVNLVYSLKFLDVGDISASENRLIHQFVCLHARHLYRYPSKYSSCANHAVAEALGLFVAGLCFPDIEGSQEWKRFGKQVLEREVSRQIYPDGSSFEHSVPYLQFLLDHFLVYYLLCDEYGEATGKHVKGRLMASFEFISNIVDKNGNVPLIGDDDDGYLLKLWFDEQNNFLSLLNTGAILFENPDWIQKDAELDIKTVLLLGPGSKQEWERLKSNKDTIPPTVNTAKYFENAGIAVIKDEIADKMLFIGNSGPLGLKPLGGHGHADALSFWLSVNGRPLFVDPGTYLYHGGGEWRDYFRSTSAHNTIRVDKTDQATILADFMYDDFYNIINPEMNVTDNRITWSARHDAYHRLADPVTHMREVVYERASSRLDIRDQLKCKGTHNIECFFHLHPECSLYEEDGAYYIESGETKIRLLVDDKWDQCSISHGDNQPLQGWYSPRFNRIQKAYTLVLNRNINGTEIFTSRIDLNT